MTIKEQLARWYIKKYLPDHHLHYSPGKHPLTRMKLNGAVSANLDTDYPQVREEMDMEEYYERKYGRAKK